VAEAGGLIMSKIPPILSIKMVPAGVELVLAALGKLPYDQSAGLIAEIRGQAEYQLQQINPQESHPQPAEEKEQQQ
jgi:hypothetical protein